MGETGRIAVLGWTGVIWHYLPQGASNGKYLPFPSLQFFSSVGLVRISETKERNH